MSVTVVLPDNKRLNIKVTINSLLSEVLEKVCTHKALDSNSYTLQRNNKPLDLSLSLRLAGIPLNCELNLVFDANKNVNQQVSISVQFEDRPRRTGQFTPSQTLWQVIENLFGSDCSELADDRLELSINFMNRQFEGRQTLQSTTLKLMGILSGRVALRMNSRPKEAKSEQKFVENIKFKKPEPVEAKVVEQETESQANSNQQRDDGQTVGHSGVKQDVVPKEGPMDLSSGIESGSANNEEQQIGSSSKPAQKFVHDNSLLKQLKSLKDSTKKTNDSVLQSKATVAENEEIDWNKEVIFLGGQNSEILYSIEDSPQFVEENVSEDFFQHTASDLKHLLAELKRQQTGDSEANLETQQTREKREKLERQKFDQTIIRVAFPYDRLILQGLFKPTDTIATLKSVVSKYIAKGTDIYLFTAPPKTILKSETQLFDLGLVPSGFIYSGSRAVAASTSQCQATTGHSPPSCSAVISTDWKAQVTTFAAASKLARHQMKRVYQKSKGNEPA